MHHSFTLAASLLTLLPTVFAAGSAHVVNNCGTDVWFASVAQNVGAPMQKLPSGGYSEKYSKANVGISIKLAATEGGPVTQFEFTWDSPNINFDISNIDGNPFAQQGTSLAPSKIGAAGYPTCVVVDCPAGQARCDAAYNLPDDVRTMVCPDDSDLTFTLCPGGAVAPAPPAAVSSSPAKASASMPASIPASIPASTPASFPASYPASTPTSAQASASSAPAFSKSAAASAAPTSFRTSTTPAANPSVPVTSQMQAPAAPSSVVQSTPDAAPATTAAAENSAPAQTYTWTRGGGWGSGWGGHYHTRRSHIHRFHS